jgi:hypothetical protein
MLLIATFGREGSDPTSARSQFCLTICSQGLIIRRLSVAIEMRSIFFDPPIQKKASPFRQRESGVAINVAAVAIIAR